MTNLSPKPKAATLAFWLHSLFPRKVVCGITLHGFARGVSGRLPGTSDIVTLKTQGGRKEGPERWVEMRLLALAEPLISDTAHGCVWCKQRPSDVLWGLGFLPQGREVGGPYASTMTPCPGLNTSFFTLMLMKCNGLCLKQWFCETRFSSNKRDLPGNPLRILFISDIQNAI